ncbi:beta-lactamase family protein [Sporothrix brasiliensis 5110]|uniref:Beta-lactamase family protein n=1 Tax=Sporothrix brasiliensis 5110 TaxID=1398154 RepID=A0A0C2ITP4_9PEZI|nr:beta-lactamase family protein [Sporothrix brasiliensis 5110]KIH92461.1 beta-lactamase family protein [Sporothrix brasiliensis 5110]
MDNFESRLAQATDAAVPARDLLGALAMVVDDKGQVLYRHAAGRQWLSDIINDDAPLLDADSTVTLGSAGKIVTHIAALQLVERGLLALDAPVDDHLPELRVCNVLAGMDNDGQTPTPQMRAPCRPITLRHLLLHTSGLADHETVDKRFGAGTADQVMAGLVDDSAHAIAQRFAIPLLFHPGEGFAYGYSIHWTQLLVTRASRSASFLAHVQASIFDPLGMASSSYAPRQVDDVWQRRLRMVERKTDTDGMSILVEADDFSQGLTCSMSDVGALLSALLSSSPVLLKTKEHYDLLLTGQFLVGSASLSELRNDSDNYGFVTGKASGHDGAALAVNWSAGGLVVGDEALPVSSMPPGTVTWEGMPNVLWAVNREKKRAAFFATQLVPVGDAKANTLALSFMHDVWSTFG